MRLIDLTALILLLYTIVNIHQAKPENSQYYSCKISKYNMLKIKLKLNDL